MRRTLLLAASGVLALSIVLLPWYSLGEYEPNGWDATWLARIALLAAIVMIILARTGAPAKATLAAALVALAAVAVRVICPPEFGFGFDDLDVPVDRLAGCWVALAAAAAATGSALGRA